MMYLVTTSEKKTPKEDRVIPMTAITDHNSSCNCNRCKLFIGKNFDNRKCLKKTNADTGEIKVITMALPGAIGC